MPASLSSITSKRATINVPVDKDNPEGDTVRVVYKPKAYDKRFERQLNAITQEKGDDEVVSAEIVTTAFLNIVAEWDLRAEDSDSEAIPLTPAGLEIVPVASLAEILTAIGDDQTPDPTTKSASRKRS